jgi:TATA-binding protein-associated factor Taf7
MDPQSVPPELSDLSIIEQQLICRISPCINIHMLKNGGIASAGHCELSINRKRIQSILTNYDVSVSRIVVFKEK